MTIILDENLPKPLKQAFSAQHRVVTVQSEGLSGTSNGTLIALLEGKFDVFVTADKNLRYQQNLTGRKIAIVEVPTNRLPILRELFPNIAEAVEASIPGGYTQMTA